MVNEVIVENEYITIQYLPERGIIYHTVHKPVSGDLFRDPLNIGIEFLREHGVTKWLSDDRKNGPLPPEEVEWAIENWNRRAISYGWKYWALVVPAEIESAGSLLPVMENLYGIGLRMRIFTTSEAALEWLNSVE